MGAVVNFLFLRYLLFWLIFLQFASQAIFLPILGPHPRVFYRYYHPSQTARSPQTPQRRSPFANLASTYFFLMALHHTDSDLQPIPETPSSPRQDLSHFSHSSMISFAWSLQSAVQGP